MFIGILLAIQLWANFGGVSLPVIPASTAPCKNTSLAALDTIGIEPQIVTVDQANVTVVFNLPVSPAMAKHISELDLEAPYYVKLDDHETQYTDAKAYIDPEIAVPVVIRFGGLANGAHRLRVGYFQIQKKARKDTIIESHFEACFTTPGRMQIRNFKRSGP